MTQQGWGVRRPLHVLCSAQPEEHCPAPARELELLLLPGNASLTRDASSAVGTAAGPREQPEPTWSPFCPGAGGTREGGLSCRAGAQAPTGLGVSALQCPDPHPKTTQGASSDTLPGAGGR